MESRVIEAVAKTAAGQAEFSLLQIAKTGLPSWIANFPTCKVDEALAAFQETGRKCRRESGGEFRDRSKLGLTLH
jgi:hypothetical protein